MHNHHESKWHWAYSILSTASAIFWMAAIVATIAAWRSVMVNDLVWGYGAQWWVINALIFGLLALYGKGHDCGACRVHGKEM